MNIIMMMMRMMIYGAGWKRYTLELILRLWADKFVNQLFWNILDSCMLVVCFLDLTISPDHMSRCCDGVAVCYLLKRT